MTLRELHEAATPAPWEASFDKRLGAWRVHEGPCVTGEQDATLTAAMRNALPLLLDVVDAARVMPQSKRLADALAALDGAA